MQNTQTQSISKPRSQTFDLIITAMLIALVFVSTVFLNIKLPITANGGLVHLGTAMLFIASILFGPKKVPSLVLLVWDCSIFLVDG